MQQVQDKLMFKIDVPSDEALKLKFKLEDEEFRKKHYEDKVKVRDTKAQVSRAKRKKKRKDRLKAKCR